MRASKADTEKEVERRGGREERNRSREKRSRRTSLSPLVGLGYWGKLILAACLPHSLVQQMG